LRRGPINHPKKLSLDERRAILDVALSEEFCDMPPCRIVPFLADQGRYVGSESSFYRILRCENLLTHRYRWKAPERLPCLPTQANGPDQVWAWDITYLPTLIRGKYYYLYLFEDLYSRMIVGAEVHTSENSDLGRETFYRAKQNAGLDTTVIRLHSDNGTAMRGWMIVATLQRLGLIASFSRPRVKNDNAHVESLFKTLKYCPHYPRKPFISLEAARQWVKAFVYWYNYQHLHSGLNYVSPYQRHTGQDANLLELRRRLYEKAKAQAPLRWSREVRQWNPAPAIELNPLSTRMVS
jgi:transposase InsO family protein